MTEHCVQVTHYSADRLVVTQTQTQTPAPVAAAEGEGGVGGVGAGQISQIIQNVLLNLIGGGLLGNTHTNTGPGHIVTTVAAQEAGRAGAGAVRRRPAPR